MPVAQGDGSTSSCPITCEGDVSACPICPLPDGISNSGSSSSVICANCPDIVSPCPLLPATRTWVFNGNSFQQVAVDPENSPPSGGHLIWFPGTEQLVDLNLQPYAVPEMACPSDVPCAPYSEPKNWEWTGNGWTSIQEASTGVTTPYFDVPPVTDLAAGNVVGLDTNGNTYISTDSSASWGKAWPVTEPPLRSDFALSYDAATSQVVLFGGTVSSQGLSTSEVVNDTWTWDGSNWTKRAGLTLSPTPSGSAVPVPSALTLPASSLGVGPESSKVSVTPVKTYNPTSNVTGILTLEGN